MSKDAITMTAEMTRDAWIIIGIRTAGLMGLMTLPLNEASLMISEKQEAVLKSAQALMSGMLTPSLDAMSAVISPFHEATSKNVVRLMAHATHGKTT